MKTNHAVAGLSLLTAGSYLVVTQTGVTIPFEEIIFQWPTILFGIGIVMLWHGFTQREDSSMFSGVLLTGLGLLFHGGQTFQLWSYDWPYFTLIIGLAFLLKHSIHKRGGLAAGVALLAITAAGVFAATLSPAFQERAGGFQWILPALLILAGLYFLLFRKSSSRTKWK